MKRLFHYFVMISTVLVIGMGACQSLWAADKYIYEQRDEAEEKKRYIVKIEQDKRKCELAIVNTKTLIGRSKNRPYLPELYLRLAELYIEKSRLVYFVRKSQQVDGGEDRALDQYEANMLKQQALEIYQRILENHSDFDQFDKVRFFMAHEFRELGQIDEMVKQYQILISKYPNSPYTPESHLLLGDYYFSQKQDVDKSKTAYEAVLKYPQSPAVAAARYKLAWCQINLANFPGALKLFEESVASPQAKKELDIDTYRRVDVRLESLIDMAYCYPEVYKKAQPDEALAYFKRYAWSRPVYTTVMEKLAYRYYVKKKWSHAAAVYRELALLRQDPEKVAEYAKHIFESVQALGKYENAERDVAIIIRALERQKYSVHIPEQEKANLLNDYELYARDIITHLHAKARKSNSKKDFKLASDAYKRYLDFFEDSPAKQEMTGNFAEALFSSGQFLEAGKYYEKVAPDATVNTRQRKDMLYSAVISYYQALKHKDNLNYYQAAYAREGLRSAGKTYVAEYPNVTHTAEVAFNVAWVSYDAGQFEAAINDFSNFVSTYPRHKATTAAVHLIMDSFHLLENYEGMITYGKSILRSGQIGDAKLRQEVAQIVRSAESKVVSTMTMAAVDNWESAREDLMQIVSESGSSDMGEQALHALVMSSKDKKDLPTFFEAGGQMIQKYPKTDHARETLAVMIDTSVKIGQYRLLADFLDLYAKRYPKDKSANLFRMQSAQIREGLGQFNNANSNYRLFLQHGKVSRQQANDVVFSYADNARSMGNIDAAIRMLEANLGSLTSDGQIRAKAMMGVLNLQADRRSKAFRYGSQVQKAYRPAMGSKDPVLLDHVAELAYSQVYYASGRYYSLKLKKKIDNKVLQAKMKMLQDLESKYQKVMAYKSPTWALKACFRANELNREFADFLMNSPVPDELNADQREQYKSLIQQKAQAYVDKADQYLKTCVQMAHKWEICDPKLYGYFNPAENPQGREDGFRSISGGRSSAEISRQGLADTTMLGLYQQLLRSPEDPELQLALAKTYMKKGDYRQSALIAQNALAKSTGSKGRTKAQLLNLLGVSQLYCGKDTIAKSTFEQAMKADPGAGEARINLAGLFRHYGHNARASELMSQPMPADLDKDGIHPRIGAIENAYVLQTK